MSIEAVREKFRWGDDAERALRLAEHAIADLFAAQSGFSKSNKDIGSLLDTDKGGELQAVIGEACEALLSNYYNHRHPRSLAHMVPPPAIASVLGDLLKGVSNQCAFTWRQGPLVPKIETTVLRWMADVLGFSEGSGGLFTSGGTSSNYIAAYLALMGAKARGHADNLCVVASDQAHFSVQKAARLIGVADDGVFLAPTGSDGRISAESLLQAVDRALGGGYHPFLFICTAGTTNAGILEPIGLFESAARSCSAWLHIDGAHGAFSALGSNAVRHRDYWRRADSVSWDPHKTLFVSYPAGALILRDPDSLASLECRPGYAFHESEPVDPAFCHLEGSRGFDALKVWLTIKHIGRDGFGTLTDYLLELARYLALRVQQVNDIELVTFPDTNIVCFRYRDDALCSESVDAVNVGIAEQLYAQGDVLLSRTTIGERAVLRAVVQNPFTTREDVDRVVSEVVRTAARITAGMRARQNFSGRLSARESS